MIKRVSERNRERERKKIENSDSKRILHCFLPKNFNKLHKGLWLECFRSHTLLIEVDKIPNDYHVAFEPIKESMKAVKRKNSDLRLLWHSSFNKIRQMHCTYDD